MGMIAGNIGEPLLIQKLEVDGISMNVAEAGDRVEILQRHGLTSEDYFFHQYATGFAGVIETAARASGHSINVKGAATVVAVVKPDRTAQLFVDKAAVAASMRLRRPVEAGSIIFEKDVLDVTALRFPFVDIEPNDQVIVLIREGWRFALYFDLTRECDRTHMETTLGRLSRTLRYFERYTALGDVSFFDALIAAGWFPFLEMRNDEFASIYSAILSGRDVEKCGRALLGGFDEARVREMAARWMSNPHFAQRKEVLMAGIEAFIRRDPVSVIKNLISEIEGILQDAPIASNNASTRTAGLIRFAVDAGARKVDDDDSLFFPTQFQRFLTENIYRKFDPMAGRVPASRHGVSHGAAPQEAYTVVRALQTILTVDQLFFYL